MSDTIGARASRARSRRVSSRRAIMATLVLAALWSCGRTDAFEDHYAPTDAPAPIDVPPSAIYVGGTGGCPVRGTEADLVLRAGERVVLADFRMFSECSGAGGEWIIGRLRESSRNTLLGQHACYFLGADSPQGAAPRSAVGLAWIQQTAALLEGPRGWCISDAEGAEPVRTDQQTRAVAFYPSEAAARAAQVRWSSP